MNPIDANGLLAMRAAILEKNSALQRAVNAEPVGGVAPAEGGQAKGVGGFADAMKGALAQVNELQAQSAAVSEAYEKGETTDIAAVMLSRQAASIGFEATLQVRNKLLTAYKDIMSMPV
jgi:flagellar hook-basal body complex protein FliE